MIFKMTCLSVKNVSKELDTWNKKGEKGAN